MSPRRSLHRRPVRTSLAIATIAVASLVGCGPLGSDAADPTTTSETAPSPATGTLLPEGTTEVEVAVGETVQVSLGEGSQSIGDKWGVVSSSEASVARAETVVGAKVFSSGGSTQPDADAPGSRRPFAVQITGLEPGTTTVRVLYCTRDVIAEGCDQSHGTREAPVDPIELTVTVR